MASDPKAPNIGKSTEKMLQAYTKYLPGLLDITAQQIAPTEQAKLEAQRQTLPGYSDLYLNTLTPAEIEAKRQTALGDVATNRMIFDGPGRDLISSARGIEALAAPELVQTRERVSKGFGDLLSTIDPTGALSPTEREEIRREVNRQNFERGNLGTPSQTSTVENAMMFGEAGRNRQLQSQAALGQALQGATSFLQGGAAPTFAPLETAMGKERTYQPSQFGAPSGTGAEAFGFGQGVESSISGLRQQQLDINASREPGWSKVLSSLPDY